MSNLDQIETGYLVPEEWGGKRLDLFLTHLKPDKSRGYFQRLLTKQLVMVNQKISKASYQVKPGDVVFLQEPSIPLFPKAESMPLDIVHEDEDILVVNKPVNMTVHPNDMETTGTLVQGLLYHSKAIAEAVYDLDSLVSRLRPGIVHRLDKDTSGLLVIAKNKATLENLSEQFRQHRVEKQYSALVYGTVTEATRIHTNLKRRPIGQHSLMKVDMEEGREAITEITPVRQFYLAKDQGEVSLINCRIETGRTHQIRVHCKHIGHPILGDPFYTNKPARSLSQRLNAHRQLLHASSLSFQHPRTGEQLSFQIPLPFDMADLIAELDTANG